MWRSAGKDYDVKGSAIYVSPGAVAHHRRVAGQPFPRARTAGRGVQGAVVRDADVRRAADDRVRRHHLRDGQHPGDLRDHDRSVRRLYVEYLRDPRPARALFALAAAVHRFAYLKQVLAVLLVFVGSKIFSCRPAGAGEIPDIDNIEVEL